MKRIILTGGGTAGHVTPNIALLPTLRELNYDIHYIGSYNGIERKLIEEMDIPYYGIDSGKLRRYFDPKNFTDPFKVLHGYKQARKLIKHLKPDVIFSKGGFVTVPVVISAHRKHIPVIIHESDMTPGLANKLCIPSADKVCCNFPETMRHLPENKPVLMIIGGSQGSAVVNDAMRGILPELLKTFQVIHLCGKGKLDSSLDHLEGYIQFEYVKKELADLFALTDVCVSRAGANAICKCQPGRSDTKRRFL